MILVTLSPPFIHFIENILHFWNIWQSLIVAVSMARHSSVTFPPLPLIHFNSSQSVDSNSDLRPAPRVQEQMMATDLLGPESASSPPPLATPAKDAPSLPHSVTKVVNTCTAGWTDRLASLPPSVSTLNAVQALSMWSEIAESTLSPDTESTIPGVSVVDNLDSKKGNVYLASPLILSSIRGHVQSVAFVLALDAKIATRSEFLNPPSLALDSLLSVSPLGRSSTASDCDAAPVHAKYPWKRRRIDLSQCDGRGRLV